MASPIIGIDLGTTNSCAAVADERGEVVLIPYRGGEFIIPSIFAVTDKGHELIGHQARRQWQLNPQRTIFGAKRMLGVNSESELVQEMRGRVGYAIEPGEADDVIIPIGTHKFRLAEIAAKILRTIRDVASDHLKKPVSRAVVTVPAYFNDRQRQGVHEAGKLAGLDVVRIINEPTAAALAYCGRKSVNETVAVYDLGGGTFDLSVIEIRDKVLEVKATGGDVFLGGIDFDSAVIEFLLSEFKGSHNIDLSTDPIAMQRIRDMAEHVKIELSERTETNVKIPFITTRDGQPLDMNLTVKRDELEALTSHLVEKTFDTCAHIVDEAGLMPDQIDEILLVGGQTRMPLIQDRIAKFFGKPPSKTVHPDEAVAIGAALLAQSLEQGSELEFQLLDVLPMAVGIEKPDGQMHLLFVRNSSVPNQKQFTFTTHRDNQKDIVLKLFQGDHPTAKENTLLGQFTFDGLRSGAAGSVRVEVVFTVNAEGMLSLQAKDHDTQAEMSQTVTLER